MNFSELLNYIQSPKTVSEQVLSEMSMQIPKIENKITGTLHNELFETATTKGDRIDDFKCSDGKIYKVYAYTRKFETSTSFYFIYNDQLIVALVTADVLTGSIKIDESYGIGGQFRGIVVRVYVEYFLQKFNAIISDRIHTIEGFNIYRRITDKQKSLGVTVSVWDITTDEQLILKDCEELEKYFGNAIDFTKYRFIIRKS